MRVILFFIFAFLSVGFVDARLVDTPLHIQFVVRTNPVGLSKDCFILERELVRLGHRVSFVNPKRGNDKKSERAKKADVNIYIEHLWEKYFPYADKNYFIPNPEYGSYSIEFLNTCDLVLCRTRYVESVFSELHPNLYYLSFISEDHNLKEATKDFYKPLHTPGRSEMKGTQFLLNVWKRRPDFPYLTFLQGREMYETDAKNVLFNTEFLTTREFVQLQNHHGLHLCPSQAEGFGHYILEAMSTGAVVITTNAPPMNEYIEDERLLVDTTGSVKQFLSDLHDIDEEHLEQVISEVLALPQEELEQIGRRNRQYYLQRREEFRERLKELFGEVR